MARLLLDSNIYLWWSASRKLLPPDIIRTIAEAGQPRSASSRLGSLSSSRTSERSTFRSGWDFLEEDGFTIAAIELADALAAARPPLHHRDPFDLMMIAQAIRRDLTIITRDGEFAAYGVSVMMV
jgi:PIN domain nuclease of toxin-antitoxin system